MLVCSIRKCFSSLFTASPQVFAYWKLLLFLEYCFGARCFLRIYFWSVVNMPVSCCLVYHICPSPRNLSSGISDQCGLRMFWRDYADVQADLDVTGRTWCKRFLVVGLKFRLHYYVLCEIKFTNLWLNNIHLGVKGHNAFMFKSVLLSLMTASVANINNLSW